MVYDTEYIKARFSRSIRTARLLPKVGPAAYFNNWPDLVPDKASGYADEKYKPTPCALDVEEMEETTAWLKLLENESHRHIVIMKAKRYPPDVISRKVGISMSTVNRHYNASLQVLADHLNAAAPDTNRYAAGKNIFQAAR